MSSDSNFFKSGCVADRSASTKRFTASLTCASSAGVGRGIDTSGGSGADGPTTTGAAAPRPAPGAPPAGAPRPTPWVVAGLVVDDVVDVVDVVDGACADATAAHSVTMITGATAIREIVRFMFVFLLR